MFWLDLTGRDWKRPWLEFAYSTYMFPGADRVPVSSTTSPLVSSVRAVAVNTLGAGRGVGFGSRSGTDSLHEVPTATIRVMAGRVTATENERIYSLFVQGSRSLIDTSFAHY